MRVVVVTVSHHSNKMLTKTIMVSCDPVIVLWSTEMGQWESRAFIWDYW